MVTRNNLPSVFDKAFFDDARFGSLLDHSVGFDQFLGEIMNEFLPAAIKESFPPYNIRQDGDHLYTIEVAIAGYSQNEIEVLVDDGTLTLKGNKVANIGDPTNPTYLVKGVASRKFERKFKLPPGAEVTGANMADGMLYVNIQTQAPNVAEPTRIPIKTGTEETTATVDDPTET